jgi:hypothetical protein
MLNSMALLRQKLAITSLDCTADPLVLAPPSTSWSQRSYILKGYLISNASILLTQRLKPHHKSPAYRYR